MTRIVATLSLFIALLLVAGAVWYSTGGEPREERREAPEYRITRVAFVSRPEGAVALVEEARPEGRTLTVVDLANGQPLDGRDFEGEGDRRRGLRRLVGGGAALFWVASLERGIHGRDPATGELLVTRAELMAANPGLAAALVDDRETRFRFDLLTGRLVIGVGKVWHRVDPQTLTAEVVPLDDLRLRTEGPQGYRAQRRFVKLKGGTRVELPRISKGPPARFDNIPTIVSSDGRRMRLSDQVKLKDPLFLYDSATDEAITPAMPASVIVVQNKGRVISRLALAGNEVWWKGMAALIPEDEQAADWARIGGAHLAGRLLVLHLGPRLVALEVGSGERVWGYPEE